MFRKVGDQILNKMKFQKIKESKCYARKFKRLNFWLYKVLENQEDWMSNKEVQKGWEPHSWWHEVSTSYRA